MQTWPDLWETIERGEHLVGKGGWCWCQPRMERSTKGNAIYHRYYFDMPDPEPEASEALTLSP